MSILPVWISAPLVNQTIDHIVIQIDEFDIEAQYEPIVHFPLISVFYHSFLYFITHL